MSLVRWFVREWMIGWHQGAKDRHNQAALRHHVAEDRWRVWEP